MSITGIKKISFKKSLKFKIILQVSSLVAVAMTFVTILVAILVKNHMSEQMYRIIENDATSIQQRLEQRFDYLVENTTLLTTNDILINSLLNEEGRKSYLPKIVKNFMQGKDVISLSVVDFDGRAIFKTQEQIPEYKNSPELRASLSKGQFTTYLQPNKDLVIIAPIEYYKTSQGAVVVVFDLKGLMKHASPNNPTAYSRLFQNEEQIFEYNYNAKKLYTSYLKTASTKNSHMGALNLSLQTGIPEEEYLQPVKDVVIRLSLLGIIFILAAVVIAILLADRITKPILHLYNRVISSEDEQKNLPISLGTDDEINALAIAFEERNEQLKEKEDMMIAQSRHAAMGEMISMIAHQWRQPITVISMIANNLLADVEFEEVEPQRVKESATKALAQTQHLSKTIDDFKNFFRPNKKAERTLVSDVLEENFAIVGKSLENNNISVKKIYNAVTPIDIFSRELLQVFINILKNAKEALVENMIEDPMITVTTSEDEEHLYISICDNGKGVDPAILLKIFDPYFSTKDEKTGTGLGLYMSKTIIEKHLHGVIKAANLKDGGVCFEISLPKTGAVVINGGLV